MMQEPAISVCSYEFVREYNRFNKRRSARTYIERMCNRFRYDDYVWIVPDKCLGYCKKLVVRNFMNATYIIEQSNAMCHSISKKLFMYARCDGAFKITEGGKKCDRMKSSNIKDFRLFKQYLKFIVSQFEFDTHPTCELFSDSLLGRENASEYSHNFKKYVIVRRLIYDNKFDIDECNHGLQLLVRKHNNIIWLNTANKMKKWLLIKRIIYLILSKFTTKNMTKLSCYHI